MMVSEPSMKDCGRAPPLRSGNCVAGWGARALEGAGGGSVEGADGSLRLSGFLLNSMLVTLPNLAPAFPAAALPRATGHAWLRWRMGWQRWQRVVWLPRSIKPGTCCRGPVAMPHSWGDNYVGGNHASSRQKRCEAKASGASSRGPVRYD